MASPVGKPGSLSDGVNNSPKPSDLIIPYLMNHAPIFRKLYEVQQRVWESPKADRHFQNQQSRADHASKKVARSFFNMMREIAKELDTATDAFSVISRGTQRPRILDMCAAPGGFLATALEMCSEAQVLAFTLPLAEGGHRVLLERDSRVKFKFLDITMLAEDMNMGVRPANNEQYGNFLPRNIAPHYLFRLVLCDGQVLRTQKRPECREQREPRRLVSTQLALGLEHTEPGGTMIILLHKLEEWDTIMLLYTFRKFSTITLFKPKRFHAKRSSFYMVASDIHSKSPQATQAVAKWKEIWNDATFKGPEEYRDTTHADERDVAGVLDEFGPGLIELGNAIWPTQEKALTKAFLCNK